MLDIKFIRDNKDLVKDAIKKRGMKLDIDEFLKLDEEKRSLLLESEQLKAQRNKANDDITAFMKEKKNPKELIDKMKVVSQKIAVLDAKVEEVDKKLANLLLNPLAGKLLRGEYKLTETR